MSTEITVVDFNQLPATQLGNDADFNDLSKGSNFLGRLQLYSKGSAIDNGLIPPGHYGIPESDTKIRNLGKTIDVLPIARRPKAIDMSDKKAIITSYDVNSETFKAIKLKSAESESGCMWGTSFLIYERSTGLPLEFFLGSKSSRPIAGELADYLPLNEQQIAAKREAGQDVSRLMPHGPLPVTLSVRLAKNGRGHTWHVPEVAASSLPFTHLPPAEEIMEEITRFLTIKNEGGEEVKEDAGKKGRAR
jgi:hypothetical protein